MKYWIENLEIHHEVQPMIDLPTEESISGRIYDIPWVEIIEAYFKKHPIFRQFYTPAITMSKEIEKDFIALEEELWIDAIKEFIIKDVVKFDKTEKFPISTVQKVINNTNFSCSGLLQDILPNTYKRNIIDKFITVFLLIQLRKIKNPYSKLNTTIYANSILHGEWHFAVYSWFRKNFGSLNGNTKNISSGQNHRLAAIVMYNHHLERLWLIEIFEGIEYIHPEKIVEFSTLMADGAAIDAYIENHYFIENKKLYSWIKMLVGEDIYRNHKYEFEWYIQNLFQEIKKTSHSFDNMLLTYIVIDKQKLNELLFPSVEQVKCGVLESIFWKNNKQRLLRSLKLGFLKIIQNNSFVFK